MQEPSLPEQEEEHLRHVRCPRCDSANTKFCYYNNYNLSQPRHFCKTCRRYWTKGGTLRNIPVGGGGGGSRKNAKRTFASDSSSPTSSAKRPSVSKHGEVTDRMPPEGGVDDGFEGQFGDFTGASFSSLLGSTEGHFSDFLDGSSELHMVSGGSDPGSGQNMDPNGLGSGGSNSNNANADGFLGGDNRGGSNGWPDLSMDTPGSSSFL